MLQKIIRYLYYILFLAVPLIIYAKTSEIFEFNKIIFIYILTILIAGVWTIKLIVQKERKQKLHVFYGIILIFFATQVISTLFSIDIHTSFFGYYGRFNGGLLSLISYVLLFYMFVSEFSWKFLENVLKITIVSSTLVMLWGVPGKFGYDFSCWIFTGELTNTCWTNQFHPDERMFSTLGQPNWLGAYLAITFFVGLYFLIKNLPKRSDRNRATSFINAIMSRPITIFYIAYLLLNFTCIIFTRSRSSLGAVLFGIVLFPILFYFSVKDKQTKRAIMNIYSIVAICFILLVLVFKTGITKVDKYISLSTYTHSQKEEVEPIQKPTTIVNTEATESLDIRKIVWKGAIQLALLYPLTGTGVETFAYSYYFVRPQEHNMTSEWDFLYNKAHNEYLNYAATTGITGLLAYLLMIGSVSFLFLKRIFVDTNKEIAEDHKNEMEIPSPFIQKILYICLLLGYLTILITNLLGFSVTSISLYFYTIPVVLLANEHKHQLYKVLTNFHKYMIGITLLAVALLLLFFGEYWYADTQYAKASSLSSLGQYHSAAYELNKVLKYHYEHVYEDKLSLAIAGAALNTDDKEDQKKLIELSTLYNDKTLLESPRNVLYWRTKGNINYNFYQATLDEKFLKEGLHAFETSEKLAPTDPRMAYMVSLYSMQIYDSEKDAKGKQLYGELALRAVNKAITLKKDYTDAYILKATIYKKMGDILKAKQTDEYILKYLDPQNENVKNDLQSL